MKSIDLRSFFLLLVAFLSSPGLLVAETKPVFLYSRYFNAPGEDRYLPDGNYKDLLQRLGRDFEVRVNDQPLTAATLKGVSVVLVANPSDRAATNHPAPHHFDARAIAALNDFVKAGGGFMIMGNQENHNLEIEDTNKLLEKFGLKFVNTYTDAKLLALPKSTPIVGGLRWAYYTGNQVQIEKSHTARPRALVMNDLNVKPAKGPRDAEGALLAIAEPGRGRVVVVTDAGWVTDLAFDEKGLGGVTLTGQDNWEIFRRLARWAAGRP